MGAKTTTQDKFNELQFRIKEMLSVLTRRVSSQNLVGVSGEEILSLIQQLQNRQIELEKQVEIFRGSVFLNRNRNESTKGHCFVGK